MFRTFPPGAAGLGLFLLRVITAFTLGYSGYLVHGRAAIAAPSALGLAKLVSLMLPLIGVLMILGFATLVSGVLSSGLLALSIGRLNPGSNDLFLIAGGLSLVLVLVGPGAYSLDARLFGLRRIEVIGRTSLTRNKHRGGR